MTKLPSLSLSVTVTIISIIVFFFFSSLPPLTHALGSGSTLAVSYGSATVCGIVASQSTRRVVCLQRGSSSQVISVQPNVSFSSIAAGSDYLCGIRSGGYALLCWDTTTIPNLTPKRIYYNNTVLLQSLAIGDTQTCATTTESSVICWRGDGSANFPQPPDRTLQFVSLTSGYGFTCGIISNNSQVRCWSDSNNNQTANSIENGFGNSSMINIVAGAHHVCGLNSSGILVCVGDNSSGQLNVPSNSPYEFGESLALGENYSCAIRLVNNSVVCWGGGGEFSSNVTDGIQFELIVAGSNFTCGLTTANFSVVCWGPGWPNNISNSDNLLSLPEILPGPCVQSCECQIYPQSQTLCSGSGTICKPCVNESLTQNSPPPPPPPPTLPPRPSPSPPSSSSPSNSKALTAGLLVFAIVGSIGGFAGICTVIYCLWTGVCFGKKKIHNSVQPTMNRAGSIGGMTSNNSPPSRSLSTIRRQYSRAMRRQRSGTSSKHGDRAEEFTLAELAAATNDFALENKLGAGSFGVVYRGKLADGHEVAIKRGETGSKAKKFQEKESAFDSELAFLSRLHHKHLVALVGYCEERDERLLVYEYMKNGALYDHLHNKNNLEKSSSVINSWKVRIKIALDAARGIEYLHDYAVPSIIHRDIKSSNILLDATWTARVSDFGLSLLGPESDRDYRPMKAAGTVGYIDPEYYGLNVLTTKSDVYGLGVVLLELLTGKRAIFKSGDNGGAPVSVVDFAVPAIMSGELVKIMDARVGPPELNEAEAVELVAYTAMRCVHLEGKERPTINDVVTNLERALALCQDSHGSISSGTISIVSE